jgi:hypothetical protein
MSISILSNFGAQEIHIVNILARCKTKLRCPSILKLRKAIQRDCDSWICLGNPFPQVFPTALIISQTPSSWRAERVVQSAEELLMHSRKIHWNHGSNA